ncbi:MAG TPA: hypothetical protein VN231_14990 [Allosphingosinicella sp.]|nr:hypothetical protein [Allosphingosinicella sp.]
MRRPAFAFLALATLAGGADAAAGEPSGPPSPADSAMIAHGDGSWSVTRPIAEPPVPIEAATGGLIVEEEEGEAEKIGEVEADEAADRAFEEAVDQARREERPR